MTFIFSYPQYLHLAEADLLMTTASTFVAGNSCLPPSHFLVKAQCSLVGYLGICYRCTCPPSLTLANKQLLHDIRNPICYPPNVSAQQLSSPAAETVTNAWAVSSLRKSKLRHHPPIAPYLCWWERKHKHLTQLQEIDIAVLRARHAIALSTISPQLCR